MNRFQWLACTALAGAALFDLQRFARRRELVRLLRALVWVAAAAAIARPDLVTFVANALGIGRGADVVLYLFVLAFLAVSFFQYGRQVRLQRRFDALVSRLALERPRRGEP